MKELIYVIRKIVASLACREISMDAAARLMEALDKAEEKLIPSDK